MIKFPINIPKIEINYDVDYYWKSGRMWCPTRYNWEYPWQCPSRYPTTIVINKVIFLHPVFRVPITVNPSCQIPSYLPNGQYVVQNCEVYPVCEQLNTDPDGDGWGWENSRSCKVLYPYCESSYSDSDGDGWGFENDQMCQVRYNYCESSASDPDGDGWGWEYNKSCKVIAPTYPTCQYFESDPDGDGWGWENNQSCKVVY